MKMSAKDKLFEIASTFGLTVIKPDKKSIYIYRTTEYMLFIGTPPDLDDVLAHDDNCLLKYSTLDRSLWIPKAIKTCYDKVYFCNYSPVRDDDKNIENLKNKISYLIEIYKSELNKLNLQKIAMDFV